MLRYKNTESKEMRKISKIYRALASGVINNNEVIVSGEKIHFLNIFVTHVNKACIICHFAISSTIC